MKVNFFTEAEMAGIKTTGIVTAYQELMKALNEEGIDVKVNRKDDYDILHIHSFGPISFKKAMKSEKPVVMTTHTVPEEMHLLYRGGKIVEPLFKKYMKLLYSQADLLFCPSGFAKRRINEMGVRSEAVIQSNGINTKKFRRSRKKGEKFKKKYQIPEDKPVVGCVGLVSKRKGLDRFVKTAKRMSNVEFVWVGKNIYGKLLKDYKYVKEIKKSHPENMTLTGYVKDIQPAYSAMDVFLFPTRIETEGLVVLEAACSELPVVTSQVDGLNWLNEGKDCLKASEIQGFVEKIKEARVRKKELLEGMNEIIERKEISSVAKDVIDYYKNLSE